MLLIEFTSSKRNVKLVTFVNNVNMYLLIILRTVNQRAFIFHMPIPDIFNLLGQRSKRHGSLLWSTMLTVSTEHFIRGSLYLLISLLLKSLYDRRNQGADVSFDISCFIWHEHTNELHSSVSSLAVHVCKPFANNRIWPLTHFLLCQHVFAYIPFKTFVMSVCL